MKPVDKIGRRVFFYSNVWIPTQLHKSHEETGKYDTIRRIKTSPETDLKESSTVLLAIFPIVVKHTSRTYLSSLNKSLYH